MPSHLSFVAKLPPRPVLQFAISVATLGKPTRWSPVRFRITVKSGHEEEVIFRETIELPQRNQWLDRSVDLAAWSETEAQLRFEVLTDDDPAALVANDPVFPLWGNPVVFSKHNPIERPPIILISVDCLRPDHMGLYGYQRNTTPRLDELAEEAFVFEKATAASSWTLPSHMSMMTGLTPSFHAVSRERKLGPSIGYLPELLSEGGYEAIGVVSGAYLSPSFGFERGFHKYRVLKRSRAAQTIDVATAWLAEAQGRDVFLFLHLFDPHWRYLRAPFFFHGPRDTSPTRFGEVYRKEVVDTPNIRVFLHANVVDIVTNANVSTVDLMEVRTLSGNRLWVRANAYILATGGIENSRILLFSNKVLKAGLGNRHGLVGRFFLEHLNWIAESAVLTQANESMDLYESASMEPSIGTPTFGALSLADHVQKRRQLVNTAFILFPRYNIRGMMEAIGDVSTLIDRFGDDQPPTSTPHHAMLYTRTEPQQSNHAFRRVGCRRETKGYRELAVD